MSELTLEQQIAQDKILAGESILIIGEAGTGKTKFMRDLVSRVELEKKIICATASTGTAAINLDLKIIQTTTLHSFIGDLCNKPAKDCFELIRKRKKCYDKWNAVELLIIEELSMIDARLFDLVDYLAKKLRRSNQWFGGIQVVAIADPMQLPPVTKEKPNVDDTELVFDPQKKRKLGQATVPDPEYYKDRIMFFESDVFLNYLYDKIICFTKNFRQLDPKFQALLKEARDGKISDTSKDILLSRLNYEFVCPDGTKPTKLFSYNRSVDQYNQEQFAKLDAPIVCFSASEGGPQIYLTKLKKKLETIVKDVIELKEGAVVMVVVNVNIDLGIINGTIGTIIRFEEDCIWIKLYEGTEVAIYKKTWREYDAHDYAQKGPYAFYKQYPLKLSYALTIHKAQGLTLKYVDIDLNNIFEAQQAYVALSRATDLEHLCIRLQHHRDIKQVFMCNTTCKLFFDYCLSLSDKKISEHISRQIITVPQDIYDIPTKKPRLKL